jgi:hypothetical protein
VASQLVSSRVVLSSVSSTNAITVFRPKQPYLLNPSQAQTIPSNGRNDEFIPDGGEQLSPHGTPATSGSPVPVKDDQCSH